MALIISDDDDCFFDDNDDDDTYNDQYSYDLLVDMFVANTD